jgi:hypothetical protein
MRCRAGDCFSLVSLCGVITLCDNLTVRTRLTVKNMSNQEAFRAPLHALDTAKQTYGCRNPNPDACPTRDKSGICSRMRADHICWSPPVTWRKQFKKLKAK